MHHMKNIVHAINEPEIPENAKFVLANLKMNSLSLSREKVGENGPRTLTWQFVALIQRQRFGQVDCNYDDRRTSMRIYPTVSRQPRERFEFSNICSHVYERGQPRPARFRHQTESLTRESRTERRETSPTGSCRDIQSVSGPLAISALPIERNYIGNEADPSYNKRLGPA